MTESLFVSDAELTHYINVAWGKTYDLMLLCYGENYQAALPLQIPTTGASFYDLPDGSNYSAIPAFYKLLGVDMCLQGLDPQSPYNFYTLYPFNFAERNRGAIVPYLNNISRPVDYRYRLQGNRLWITPVPITGSTLQLWYAPTLTPLASDSDAVTNLQPGWEELIELDAAIKMLIKSQQDTTQLEAMKQEAAGRLKLAATNRDAAAPGTVVDVYGPGSGFGGMGGTDGGLFGGGF